MGNILHQLEAAEDDANLAFLRSEVARLQSLADRRGEIAVDRRREIERLRLTDEEREAIEAAVRLLPDGPYTDYDGTVVPDRRAILRALLERLGTIGHQE